MPTMTIKQAKLLAKALGKRTCYPRPGWMWCVQETETVDTWLVNSAGRFYVQELPHISPRIGTQIPPIPPRFACQNTLNMSSNKDAKPVWSPKAKQAIEDLYG